MVSLVTVANIGDLRTRARKRLPRHLFDFIDGAAFREVTRDDNLAELAKLRFRQRTLRDVSRVTLATTLLGQDATMPLAIAPTGMSGILAGGARGELLAAKASAAAGIPFTLGMMALSSIEDVCAVAPPPFFQMCMMRDRQLVGAMVKRAEAAGCPALVLTTTWPYYSQHDRLTNNPAWSMPPRILSRALLEYAARPAWSISTLFGRGVRFRNFDAHRAAPWDIVERSLVSSTHRQPGTTLPGSVISGPESWCLRASTSQKTPNARYPLVPMPWSCPTTAAINWTNAVPRS